MPKTPSNQIRVVEEEEATEHPTSASRTARHQLLNNNQLCSFDSDFGGTDTDTVVYSFDIIFLASV